VVAYLKTSLIIAVAAKMFKKSKTPNYFKEATYPVQGTL